MWKTVHGNVAGTSHELTGCPCQDACRVRQVSTDGASVLIVACSDGAGSAKHSHHGSARICDEFVSIIERHIKEGLRQDSIDRELGIRWCTEIRESIGALALEIGCEARDLAATFLGVVMFDGFSCFLQVGDGAIVAQYDGLYEAVFWPQSGEYLNTTNFLTDEQFSTKLDFCLHDGVQASSLAVFTDGLERLILQYSDKSVHIPFLEPLFDSLQRSESPELLREPMRQFLSSEAINQRTDDDKTLILASRQRDPVNGNAAN